MAHTAGAGTISGIREVVGGVVDLQPIYRSLLEGGNLDVLLTLGRTGYLAVTSTCADAGVIRPVRQDWDGVEDIMDLLVLLRTKLQTGGDAVRFTSLTIRFRDRLRTRSRYPQMHRICTEMHPLLELVRVHRNRQQHQRRERPTPAQVRSLSSAILHLLDLASGKLRSLPDWQALEREARVAIGAVGEDPGPLQGQIDELKRENRSLTERNRSLEQLASKATISVSDIQELIASRHEETVTRICDRLGEESGRIRSTLSDYTAHVTEQQREVARRVSELAPGTVPSPARPTPQAGRPSLRPSPAEQSGVQLGLAAAEKELRSLRDRIRNENPDVKPWENICMLRPIVEQAVQAAADGNLKTLEQWKRLPAVRQKFSDAAAVAKRDAQLRKYGEPMMAILRRIESAEADPGF